MNDSTDQFPLSLSYRSLRFPDSPTQMPQLLHEQVARMHRAQQEQVDGLLRHLAETAFELDRARSQLPTGDETTQTARESLEILVENLEELLQQHNVRTVDLTGRTWKVEMREDVELRGHQVREDLDEPRVAYMQSPVIYRQNRRIAKGTVLVETPRRG